MRRYFENLVLVEDGIRQVLNIRVRVLSEYGIFRKRIESEVKELYYDLQNNSLYNRTTCKPVNLGKNFIFLINDIMIQKRNDFQKKLFNLKNAGQENINTIPYYSIGNDYNENQYKESKRIN